MNFRLSRHEDAYNTDTEYVACMYPPQQHAWSIPSYAKTILQLFIPKTFAFSKTPPGVQAIIS